MPYKSRLNRKIVRHRTAAVILAAGSICQLLYAFHRIGNIYTDQDANLVFAACIGALLTGVAACECTLRTLRYSKRRKARE